MSEEQTEIAIEDLELSLEVYQIESQQKLAQLQKLFQEKGSLDLSKVFYEERSTIKIKFQNIISDLIEFLVKQEVATTEKLRKTFYQILENPLLLLFKISRFEIFDLRLNGFDIQLEPIQAITELGKTLNKNIDDYLELSKKNFKKYDGKEYHSWDAYMDEAIISQIQDKIFVFYSYLRKGGNLLKKKFQNKIKIVQIFNNIQQKLFSIILKNGDKKTLKQLSVLNYQIYELEQSFDVLNFYLQIPFHQAYKQSFQEFQLLASKSKQSSNYNMYILSVAKYGKEIMNKIKHETIDPCYDLYLENALKAILEMWGCRMCYYQEICDLFTIIFDSHSNRVQILEVCLKHTPNMQKDDIVLLRTNFKLEMSKKHNQLLSLMKSRNLQQINDFLNSFYHRTFYNMDFSKIDRQNLINILTLMNGNSSLKQFFTITQRALKQWNHSIDLNLSHKFIESQFVLPKLSDEKINETFILLTNLCILEQKGFNKQYQELIRANTIGKALLGLINFINNDDTCKEIRKSRQAQNLIVQTFLFLRKCLNPTTDAAQFTKIYSSVISRINNEEKKNKLEDSIINYTLENIQQYHIHECISIFSQCKKANLINFIQIFFHGIAENNQIVKNYKFIDLNAEDLDNIKISKSEQAFIKQNYVIKNNVLSAKDPGIFKLSQFQVMTNPIQFQRVMDNYYFTLDANSKKFIEFLISLWSAQNSNKDSQSFVFYSNLIREIIQKYPICIPILASTRIEIKQGQETTSKRFIQLLAMQIGNHQEIQYQILEEIVKCNSIRYRNGKDYIQGEIMPMILKQLLNNLNAVKVESIEDISQSTALSAKMVSTVFIKSDLKSFKSQTLQKTVQKIIVLMRKVTKPKNAAILSDSHHNMMKAFFLKKQMDMRKTGLVKVYDNVTWNQTRNYASSSGQADKQIIDVTIPEQIMVTPYAISQDFNIQEFKIKKNTSKKAAFDDKPAEIKLSEVCKNIPNVKEDKQAHYFSSGKKLDEEKCKNITIKNSKHNLITLLGNNTLQELSDKENLHFSFQQKNPSQNQQIVPSEQKRDENNSLVQFYLKQFEIPAISHKVILQDIVRLLNCQAPQVSHLWTNCKNLEYYFMDLFSIFEYASLDKQTRKPEDDKQIEDVLKIVHADEQSVLHKILLIFSKLGYSNIWAESLNMFWNNFPIRKHLGLNKPSQESILSVVLNISLKNDNLRESLNNFLGKLFEKRGNQTALMYKVTMDKHLMNLIMKSLSIEHLNKISLLFHSNFNNLRLYTDQLHEGLKALNMASTNRSYNQFIKLSRTVEDEEFQGPMKLFKQNFSFFIRIQKQGYIFKKNEEKKLIIDRLNNIFRTCTEKQNIGDQVDAIMKQYIKQIQQLQVTIGNRVRSFYLVTKLRDLSYQNSLMISIIQSVMHSEGKSTEYILNQIKKVEIFSLMNQLYNQLIIFEDDWRDIEKYSTLIKIDENKLHNQLTICSTRRFSHSMSKIYEKCDLQFDQVIQRCFNALKVFFNTETGRIWLNQLQIYPAFLIKSFIDHTKAQKFSKTIKNKLQQNKKGHNFEVNEKNFIEDLVKGFRYSPIHSFTDNTLQIMYNNKKYTPATILPIVVQKLIQNQTLVSLKTTNHLLFNKYKMSEATLQEIQIIGYIISYSLLTQTALPFKNPLHPSIISCISFNISDLDYLLDIDFKIWQQLKNILSCEDSSKLQLNFSYNFQSLETFKPIRIQLVDKGSSKKVNNLNRQQYCDLICSYILYENLRPQMERLLTTILKIVPKEYICCQSTKSILTLFYNKEISQKLMNQFMNKIGIVLPETIIDENGKRYENLKDYQNIQWLTEEILKDGKLKEKYWKDQTNIFIVTHIGAHGSIRLINGGQFLVEHFNSREELKASLAKL